MKRKTAASVSASSTKPKGAHSIVMRSVSDLRPYARNPRTHSDAQIDAIAQSIERFGFTNPVLLDGKNNIIAGHGRLLAAAKLKLKVVPTIDLHGLSKDEQRAYVIADNQLALSAGWDIELLKSEIADLTEAGFDTALLGFSAKELEALAKGWPEADLDGIEADESALKGMVVVKCRKEDLDDVHEAISLALRAGQWDDVDIQLRP